MKETYWCCKCKNKVEADIRKNQVHKIETKRGNRLMRKSNCPVCKTTVCKFIANPNRVVRSKSQIREAAKARRHEKYAVNANARAAKKSERENKKTVNAQKREEIRRKHGINLDDEIAKMNADNQPKKNLRRQKKLPEPKDRSIEKTAEDDIWAQLNARHGKNFERDAPTVAKGEGTKIRIKGAGVKQFKKEHNKKREDDDDDDDDDDENYDQVSEQD